MKKGININTKATKGKRGYHRLNNQKHRLRIICKMLEKHYKINDIMVVSQDDIKKLKGGVYGLFEKMDDGDITKTRR